MGSICDICRHEYYLVFYNKLKNVTFFFTSHRKAKDVAFSVTFSVTQNKGTLRPPFYISLPYFENRKDFATKNLGRVKLFFCLVEKLSLSLITMLSSTSVANYHFLK